MDELEQALINRIIKGANTAKTPEERQELVNLVNQYNSTYGNSPVSSEDVNFSIDTSDDLRSALSDAIMSNLAFDFEEGQFNEGEHEALNEWIDAKNPKNADDVRIMANEFIKNSPDYNSFMKNIGYSLDDEETNERIDPFEDRITPEMVENMNQNTDDLLYKQMLLNARNDGYNGPEGDLMYELYHPNSPRFNKKKEEFNPYDL